jgi:hypothetical protein
VYLCVEGLALPILVLAVSLSLDSSLAGFLNFEVLPDGTRHTPKAADIAVAWPSKSVAALSAQLAPQTSPLNLAA